VWNQQITRLKEPYAQQSGKRRTSFGSQTQTGSTFVARMLTVVTSLKLQRRNVLEFMTNAVGAARNGTPAPSLLTEVKATDEQVINAA